jgi:hypothetical protein
MRSELKTDKMEYTHADIGWLIWFEKQTVSRLGVFGINLPTGEVNSSRFAVTNSCFSREKQTNFFPGEVLCIKSPFCN